MPPACNRHPSLRASAPAADSHVALLDPVTCEASRERLGDKRDDHLWERVNYLQHCTSCILGFQNKNELVRKAKQIAKKSNR
jgi:hypothetical protein